MQKWTESQWKSYQSWTEEMKQQYIVNLKKSTAYRLSPLPEHEKWVKPAYLKNDSIYNISRFFKWDKIPCLQGKNINLVLHFADDTLYRIVVILHYTSKEFTTVKEDYNKLVKELEGKYFKEPFTSRDEVKKKQVGEGYFFRPYKGNKNKIEQYMINYGTSYDYKSEIREYDLIIEYVNTKHTKFSKGESE